MLNPDIPPEGIDRRAYLDKKFGGPARVERLEAAIRQAGEAEGIPFALDKIERTPNSLASHRLIRLAAREGREAVMIETLFHAYFVEGRDIGRPEVLLDLGRRLELPITDVAAILISDEDLNATLAENARSHRQGVSGIPCYIFDGRFAIAGAHEPGILLRMLDAAQEFEAPNQTVTRLAPVSVRG